MGQRLSRGIEERVQRSVVTAKVILLEIHTQKSTCENHLFDQGNSSSKLSFLGSLLNFGGVVDLELAGAFS